MIIKTYFITDIELFGFLILKKNFVYYADYRKIENLFETDQQKLSQFFCKLCAHLFISQIIYILIYDFIFNFSHFFFSYLFIFFSKLNSL